MNKHEKIFSKIGINYLTLGLLSLVFQIIVINIIPLNDINTTTILIALCNYILPLPVFIYLMRKLKSTTLPKQSINFKTFILYLSITFTLMWIGNIISLLLTSLIGSIIHNDISNPIQNLINSTNIWLNIILISIIGPVFEEILFRKVLIDRTIKYGAKVSIILSALLFALFHGNLNQFFYAFLMGGFFAYIYIKTGKITYTITLHLIINLLGSVVSLFVLQSAHSITSGSPVAADFALITIYFAVFILFLIIGINGLLKYKTARFNGLKTEIQLVHPIKTMILNYGMILFIGFYMFEIIYQLLI